MQKVFVIEVFLLSYFLAIVSRNVSLVAVMMIRDEEVNLRSNLPVWSTFTKNFVFLVDRRTKDNSVETIKSILSRQNVNFHLEYHEFDGFGNSRTRSLIAAWQIYPNISHVIICDPDWRPRLNTIHLQDLDPYSDVYRFVVFDRSGSTNRRMDWLLSNRRGLAMRYGLHEVLDIGLYNISLINWIFDEVEQYGSWHATVGHVHSMSAKRLAFDLDLLKKDLLIYPHDAHVDYYLGVTYKAYARACFQETGIVNETAEALATMYLKKRIASVYRNEFLEQRWACMYDLAHLFGLQVLS
jgi:hypothetical protein